MPTRYSNEDYHKATRHLRDLALVEIDAPIFGTCTDDTSALIGFETEILETLAEAQEDAVRHLLFVHPPVRRRKGATTGPAVLRWLLTRAPWTWDYVKRAGVRFFRDATLAEIRLPAPSEAECQRHHDRHARRAVSTARGATHQNTRGRGDAS